MENTEEESNNSGVKSSDQVPETKNHSDQEEDPSVDSSSQILVLVTPPKPFNMHTREVDDSDDFVGQCICGGAITVETDEKGRNYYVCKDFKNDGLHIRHDCLAALEKELDCLRSQYAEEVSLRRELQFELAQMRSQQSVSAIIAYHHDLGSDATYEMGTDLEWRLASFGAPYLNEYGESFKFPDDGVISSPKCLYGHDYTVDFEASEPSRSRCRIVVSSIPHPGTFVHPELPDESVSSLMSPSSLSSSSSSSSSSSRLYRGRLRGRLSSLFRVCLFPGRLIGLMGGVLSISRISSTSIASSKRASSVGNSGVSKPSLISSFNPALAILIKYCSSFCCRTNSCE
ncbi:hypothetical protein Bca52824_033755 [Brassica carinata]|uniref:Uncharacterized protein n=1 Tax=Brassica carinata TaxID=52824 RepID=A0A8X7SDH5_BRACI|nr:hypothetical protein Bca52824_033755 [Brassica carinata]